MRWDEAAGAYEAVTADGRFLRRGGSRQEAVARLAHAVAPAAGSDEAFRGSDRFPIWTLLGFLLFAVAGLNGLAALNSYSSGEAQAFLAGAACLIVIGSLFLILDLLVGICHRAGAILNKLNEVHPPGDKGGPAG